MQVRHIFLLDYPIYLNLRALEVFFNQKNVWSKQEKLMNSSIDKFKLKKKESHRREGIRVTRLVYNIVLDF